MKDGDEIEKRLINELEGIHRRISELQALEANHKRAEKTLQKAQTRLKNQFQKQTAELASARGDLQTEKSDREQAEELASLLVAAGRTSIVAVKTSIDAICAWSPDDGKLLFCNRAFLERWGIEGGYHDMYNSDCFDDDPKSSILQKVTQATISGGWSGELMGRAMDGRTFPVLVNTSPILNKEGTVVGLLGIFKDITELKQVAEEKKLLISAVEQSIDGVAMADLELRLTYVNAAYARMHGYSPEEMIGMKVTDLRSGEHLDKFERVVEKLRIKGFWQGEGERIRKDGTPFPTYLTVTLLKDKEGNPDRFVAVTRDITERKQAEKQLRESEEFSSELLADSPNPILVVNPDTSIEYVNPAFGKLTGFSSKEVVGIKPPYPWWCKETLKKNTSVFKKAMRQGYDKLELPFQKKNGEPFWVEIHSLPVVSEGEFKYYLSNWTDITERKQAEKQLRESEEFSTDLLLSAPNPIVVYNADASIRYVNPALEKLTGFSSEQVVGLKPPYPWWRKGTLKKDASDFGKAICGGGAKRLEWQFQKKNGEQFWVELNSTPIMQEGECKYHLSNWVDITERKQAEDKLHRAYDELDTRVQQRTRELAETNTQLWDEIAERKFAEEALEEAEREFRNILSSLFHLVFVLDTEGRLTYCYPAKPELLYLPPEKFIGKKTSEVMPPHVSELVADAFSQNRRGEIAEYEYQLEINGETRRFSAKLSPMFLDGKFAGSVAVVRDINL